MRHVNSVNSYSAVLPPSPMVFLRPKAHILRYFGIPDPHPNPPNLGIIP